MAAGMSLKDKAILATLGMVILYAAAFYVLFFMQLGPKGAWKKSRTAYERACKRYADETKLIRSRSALEDQYEEAKDGLPWYSEDADTDTMLRTVIRDTATRCHVVVTGDKTSDQRQVDDLYETPFSSKFEGSFESVVRFLYELENSTNGIFTVTQVDASPTMSKQGSFTGIIKGSIALKCTYMRGEKEADEQTGE